MTPKVWTQEREKIREIFDKHGTKIVIEELIEWIRDIPADKENKGYLGELSKNLAFALTEYEGRYQD